MYASPNGDKVSVAGHDAVDGPDAGLDMSMSTAPASPANMPDDEVAVAQAIRILQFISTSREYFPAMRDLADHPGWEIMLHLFICGREDLSVTTADLCERTGTWRPLAIRYIEMLFERGLIDREISSEKPDAWALRLTPETESRLRELLCSFARNAPAIGATN